MKEREWVKGIVGWWSQKGNEEGKENIREEEEVNVLMVGK